MNTDIDYIIIEPLAVGESALAEPPRGTSRRRVMFGLAACAVVSGVVLTSCFAFKGRSTDTIARPPAEKYSFRLEEQRPWVKAAASPAKQTTARPSSSGKTGSFHLTFDDGPHPACTPPLLDWLKQNHIQATFFLVGANVERYPALVKRIADEGHKLGNHTWSHPNLSGMSDVDVRSQIKRTHDAIVKASGKAPTEFRPPYGALKSAQKSWIEKEFGYQTVLWDIDTEDWKISSANAVAARIEKGLKKGGSNIILAHDIHPRILPALQRVLPKLQPGAAAAVARSQSPAPVELAGW